MKSFLLILGQIAFVLGISFAQTPEDLQGKWLYDGVNVGDQQLDETAVKMMDKMFGDMSIVLLANGNCIMSVMGQSDHGNWTFDDAKSAISIMDKNGRSKEYSVTNFTNEAFIFGLGPNGLKVKKGVLSAEEADLNFPATAEVKRVTVSKDQIAKRWYATREDDPNMSDKDNQLVNELMEGMYMEFAADGSYVGNALIAEETGTWKLGENKETIIVQMTGESQVWSIVEVTVDRLGLVRGKSGNTRYFVTKQP